MIFQGTVEKCSFPLGLNPGGWRLEVQEGTPKTDCFRKRSQAKERGPDNLCLLPQISPTPGLFRSEPLNLHFVLQLDGDRVCSSQSKQHDTPVQATCSSLSFCPAKPVKPVFLLYSTYVKSPHIFFFHMIDLLFFLFFKNSFPI